MPDWPANLPFFTDGSTMTRSGPINATIRTEVGAGPAKTRPRFSTATRTRPGRIPRLTLAQMQAFEAFFADDLAFGALSFTATDPIDCAAHEFRILSYEITRSGAAYFVDAELEVLP